ncbi:MAG TPA: hypothetical protein VEG38_01975 [Acidimicrobiia bacterium]|nr:hypothetical protein [Acidimicrobiia bacterium]
MKSPVRRALSISIPFSVAILVLGVSYEAGQSKAREDTSFCNKYFGPGRPGYSSSDPYDVRQLQLCLDGRRAKRWGPWNAWVPLIPAPDED